MIRIVLVLAIALLFLYFLRKRGSSQTQAWSKIGAFIVLLLAIIAVIFPNTTNDAAHALGVGRGADLLLYTVTLAFLASVLIQYTYRKDEQAKVVKLTRHIAIVEANQKYRSSAAGKHDT